MITCVRVTYNDNIVRVTMLTCARNIVHVRMITCVLVSRENVRVVVFQSVEEQIQVK